MEKQPFARPQVVSLAARRALAEVVPLAPSPQPLSVLSLGDLSSSGESATAIRETRPSKSLCRELYVSKVLLPEEEDALSAYLNKVR